jgi:hypothetical protein
VICDVKSGFGFALWIASHQWQASSSTKLRGAQAAETEALVGDVRSFVYELVEHGPVADDVGAQIRQHEIRQHEIGVRDKVQKSPGVFDDRIGRGGMAPESPEQFTCSGLAQMSQKRADRSRR